MEIPFSLLIIIILALLALAVVFGFLDPILIKLGLIGTHESTEKTLLCSEWSAKDCSPDYYNTNTEFKNKIDRALECSGDSDCRQKCRGLSFCLG